MTDVTHWPTASSKHDDSLVRAVEQFLYEEAELLDRWKLHEWLALFSIDGTYMVPSTDKPDGDPAIDLFLIHDDRFLLEQRVNSLLTRAAHAEYPHSRTRRLVTNVRVTDVTGDRILVAANFSIHRSRSGSHDVYVGHYAHVLEITDNGFRFITRRAVLDLEALRPHGKISIII